MIERVARALCGSDRVWDDLPEDKMERRAGRYRHDVTREDYRDDARAALNALREPTETMVAKTCVWTADATKEQTATAQRALTSMREYHPLAMGVACDVVRDWQTMIDAALAEGE